MSPVPDPQQRTQQRTDPLPTSPRQETRPTARREPQPSRPSNRPPVLGRPRWSGSTAAALLHAVFALCLGVLTVRQDGGWSTWEGWVVLAPAVVILAGQGRPWTRWPLLVQGAGLAGVAAVTSAEAMAGTSYAVAALGVCLAALAGLALQTAGALGRRGA